MKTSKFWPIHFTIQIWTDFHENEAKKGFFLKKKKFKMADFSKWPFFKIANSRNFFVKISQICPWVNRIDWCKGHWCGFTYMAVRLSDISSRQKMQGRVKILMITLVSSPKQQLRKHMQYSVDGQMLGRPRNINVIQSGFGKSFWTHYRGFLRC